MFGKKVSNRRRKPVNRFQSLETMSEFNPIAPLFGSIPAAFSVEEQ
jgi:hypothetical protein